jgi:hypothetical protein
MSRKEEGVVGIVVTILLIGLILAVISIIQTVYIPEWMKQREAEHMDKVMDQFAHLKLGIDTLSLTSQRGIPISVPITLGSRELPFFVTSRAFGSLNLLQDACQITISNATHSFNYSLGVIKYTSSNAYYLDISFVYEAGGVIKSQEGESLMIIKPGFSVANNTYISFVIVNISSIGSTSITGYGTHPIEMEYLDSSTFTVYSAESISINTSYTQAWRLFLNQTLKKFPHSLKDGEVRFPTVKPNIIVRFIETKAQISPGWSR